MWSINIYRHRNNRFFSFKLWCAVVQRLKLNIWELIQQGIHRKCPVLLCIDHKQHIFLTLRLWIDMFCSCMDNIYSSYSRALNIQGREWNSFLMSALLSIGSTITLTVQACLVYLIHFRQNLICHCCCCSAKVYGICNFNFAQCANSNHIAITMYIWIRQCSQLISKVCCAAIKLKINSVKPCCYHCCSVSEGTLS